jgi:hypothetical protein
MLDASLTASVNISLGPIAPEQVNFAPLLPGAGVVLLGEADKITAVSTFRFRSATVTDLTTGGLTIAIAGAPGETVTLMWVSLSDLLCYSQQFTFTHTEEVVQIGSL